jgi:homoserine dehydrogenase
MSENGRALGVAIVGCGTVGGATAKVLTRDAAILAGRVGPRVELKYVVDLDFTNARRCGLDEKLFTGDLKAVLADGSVGAVVELVGGTTVARKIIEQALRAGKSVVTANKALLAHHGVELYALARKHGVCVSFEASCGGGIPIIRALYDGLIANRIDALYGIVNGTCNYILTAMTRSGQSYADALAVAQAGGLAEADPTLDVAGIDSAHKLAILAALAFGAKIDFESIPVTGIDRLDIRDVNYGQELGYVVKLLAIGTRQADGLSLRVSPAFISKEHPLAWVSGPFNAVSVYGHATGHTMYYGRGAGGMPTASAVVADLVSVATGTAARAFEELRIWPDRTPPAVQLPAGAARSRYYFRADVEDHPGVLAQIATIFARHDISISSVLQHEPGGKEGDRVPLVITTHTALGADVAKARAEVDGLGSVKAPSVCVPIVEEYPEQL